MVIPSRPQSFVQRGRRAIQPAPRAGRAAADVVARFSKEFGSSIGELANRWSEIVGERTARMCSPVKLTGRGKDGVLHVAAIGPAAVLVEADSGAILQKVNRYFGNDVARRLSITRAAARKAGPAPAPKPAKAAGLPPTARLKLEAELAGIEDPGLKAALMKLGQATLREKTQRSANGGG